ncbi:hypothetical protein F4782DRAFT_476316 [Xylaria castorea]|nr:hypothetical protein F4782DRAFT_476316 [Xylaria castorea]
MLSSPSSTHIIGFILCWPCSFLGLSTSAFAFSAFLLVYRGYGVFSHANCLYFHRAVNLNHFRLMRVVGRGAFGKVRIVERKDTGLSFALKYIRKDEGWLLFARIAPSCCVPILLKYGPCV